MYCTLEFVTNNGRTIPPVSIRHGRKFSDFRALTKYGYDFQGWTSDGAPGTFKPGDSLVVVQDLTFQAQFTPIEYNISYDFGEYGKTSPDLWPTYTIESEDYSIPNPITKTYYRDKVNFDGWWRRGKQVTEIPHGSTGDIELLSKWQPKEMYVEFQSMTDPKDPSHMETLDTKYVLYKSAIGKLPEMEMELPGYTFLYWEIGAEQLMPDYIVQSSLTSTAKWLGNDYKLSFNANGGEVHPTEISVVQGDLLPELPTPLRGGFTFAGWFCGEDHLEEGSLFHYGQDIVAVAAWEANTYYVKFNPNGGTGSMSNQTFTYGVAQRLDVNAFKRSIDITLEHNIGGSSEKDIVPAYKDFLGWATKVKNLVEYSDQQSVSNLTSQPGGIVNLHAKWSEDATLNFTNDTNLDDTDEMQFMGWSRDKYAKTPDFGGVSMVQQ